MQMTAYVLAISAVLLAFVSAFIWTRTGAMLLVAAAVLMVAGCVALGLAQMCGADR